MFIDIVKSLRLMLSEARNTEKSLREYRNNKEDIDKKIQQTIQNKLKNLPDPQHRPVSSEDENTLRVSFQGSQYEVDLDEALVIPQTTDIMTYLDENSDTVYKHALKKYRKLIEQDLEFIDLFIYGDKVMASDPSTAENGLEECLEYFIQSEQYEYASETRDLIDKLD